MGDGTLSSKETYSAPRPPFQQPIFGAKQEVSEYLTQVKLIFSGCVSEESRALANDSRVLSNAETTCWSYLPGKNPLCSRAYPCGQGVTPTSISAMCGGDTVVSLIMVMTVASECGSKCWSQGCVRGLPPTNPSHNPQE